MAKKKMTLQEQISNINELIRNLTRRVERLEEEDNNNGSIHRD